MTLRAIALLATALALTGCAVVAPPYQPAVENIEALKKGPAGPARMGAFTVQSGMAGGNSVSLRGNTMTSPVGGDYAGYLAEAMKRELEFAQKLDPKSAIEISGVLSKNNVDASGISTGNSEIEARFTVRRDGAVRFDKVKRAQDSWESSFVGAVAIPKAQQQYPVLVQKLLLSLYSDAEFQGALR